jgi:hypothetical protein
MDDPALYLIGVPLGIMVWSIAIFVAVNTWRTLRNDR